MEATETQTILLTGRDAVMRTSCQAVLQSMGYSVKLALNEAEALSCLGCSGSVVDAVLIDVGREASDGLRLLRAIRTANPDLPAIVVSESASSEDIVIAMKTGAADYVCKPVEEEHLRKAVRRALEPETRANHSHRAPRRNPEMFEGDSPSMRGVLALIGALGASDAPVLIQGETGTGKEVIARKVHEHSRRSDKPFLKINCAALPSELIESELFGYERGAFTGAMRKKMGLFEEANGGTLLLDEIGDMDCRLQSKLLHVLQDNSFLRVGGRGPIRIDVRVMAATHCNLADAIANRTFREDLFYRLNVINIHLPPLRDRKDDVLPLAEFLMRKHATPGVAVPVLTAELRNALTAYDWPGNIRELENCVRKLLILGGSEAMARELGMKSRTATSARDTGPSNTGAKPLGPENTVGDRRQPEAEAILAALNSTCWNRRRAAALLQIHYNSLRLKMKKLGIGSVASSVSRAGGNCC